jgi:anthranilate phosphoribosyltransferase
VSPEQFGLSRATADELKGGDPTQNAQALRELFDGAVGPYRDIVRMNAAAALVVSGKARDMAQGMELAAEALDFGRAREKLEALIRVTNTPLEEAAAP